MYRTVRSTSAVEARPRYPRCSSSSIRKIALANLCAPSLWYSAPSCCVGPRGTCCRLSSASVPAASHAECLRLYTICPTGSVTSIVQSTRSVMRWLTNSLRRRSCVYCVLTGGEDDLTSRRVGTNVCFMHDSYGSWRRNWQLIVQLGPLTVVFSCFSFSACILSVFWQTVCVTTIVMQSHQSTRLWFPCDMALCTCFDRLTESKQLIAKISTS